MNARPADTTPLLPERALFAARFREELQYRAAALAGLFTQTVFGFIFLMVLGAFYAAADADPGTLPMDWPQVVAYIWLGQAFLGLLPWNVDPAALNTIRSGEIARELLRPLPLYRLWFAQVLAWRLVRTALRCLPMIAIAMLLLPALGLSDLALPAPAGPQALGLFVVGAVLALLLSSAITVLMQVAMLWLISPEGLLRLVPAFAILLAGNLIPLPLLPDPLQPFLAIQPFRGLMDTPLRLYSGSLAGTEALIALGGSLFWSVTLILLGRWLLTRGTWRLAVAGG